MYVHTLFYRLNEVWIQKCSNYESEGHSEPGSIVYLDENSFTLKAGEKETA